MSNLLLARPKLSTDYLDLSYGEAHIVRETLFRVLDLNSNVFAIDLLANNKAEYQSPTGYAPLVKYLEDKHQAPIVISNGAKQALAASFYALHKMGKRKLGMTPIHWCLFPPIIRAHNLEPVSDICDDYDAYLAVLPRNPDGQHLTAHQAQHLASWHKELGIPFIYDGVYNSPVYLPNYEDYGSIGDVEVYSMSKFLGVSGLRCGYAVIHNEEMYHLIQEYIEMMTVGVSTASQDIVLSLLSDLKTDDRYVDFYQGCQNGLAANKAVVADIREDILELPVNIFDVNGMFLFARCLRPDVFEKAKIHIADGCHFGREGYIRMNLAVKKEVLIEVVERLNNV